MFLLKHLLAKFSSTKHLMGFDTIEINLVSSQASSFSSALSSHSKADERAILGVLRDEDKNLLGVSK